MTPVVNHQAQLDNESPAAKGAKTGTTLVDIINKYNQLQADFVALKTKYIALLAKLDADAGVSDTDYAASETPAATTSSQLVALGAR